MAEEKPKRKPIHVRRYLRLGIVLGAALFVFLGLSKLTHWDFSLPDHVGAPDDVMGYKDSEITEMIAGENRELKQLIVYEQDIEASMDITDMFLDIDWFRKKQTVHLIATAEYIVDLSKITDKDITVDRNDRRITIVIPRAELKNVNIDYSKTTFDDIERNIFGWGDIKLTPEQQNEVEKDLHDALLAEASETPYLVSADMAGMRQVESIYKKVLSNLKNGVEVVVVLDMNIAD